MANRREQGRPDVLERRRRWFDCQLDLVSCRNRCSSMRRRRRPAWRAASAGACSGQRLRCGVPHGHYKAITFVFGLRLRGVIAPKAYDHAMNAETFEAWLEHHLLPTLEEGDIVVLDNLKVTKAREWRKSWPGKTARYDTCRIQPGLQPHRDGDFHTQKRAGNWPSAPLSAFLLSWRAAPLSSSRPNAKTISRPAGMIPANSRPSTQPERIPL